uniref:Uncharacterized protein n=1 Tax=Parascaris equorum TaxID=6256 RepID=A0A914RIY6_PAREQ
MEVGETDSLVPPRFQFSLFISLNTQSKTMHNKLN